MIIVVDMLGIETIMLTKQNVNMLDTCYDGYIGYGWLWPIVFYLVSHTVAHVIYVDETVSWMNKSPHLNIAMTDSSALQYVVVIRNTIYI